MIQVAHTQNSGANRGRSNGGSVDASTPQNERWEQPEASACGLLDLAAELLHLANLVAKAFAADTKTQRRFYDIKDSLLSTLLLDAVPGVRPSWQPKSDGFPMLTISVGNRRSLHCPFKRLSWAAQAAVVQRIGPCPTSKRQ
ncbi:MAG: hypothetical protein J5J06_20040 [Phycisphaerae bacterium]|nr:hypothetical protein [Phycisphaerae bacterium]